MPSPFPGMDPYLEGSLWTTLHSSLAVEITRQLIPRLSPHYLVLPTERLVMENPEDVAITTSSIYPDVSVLGTPSPLSFGCAEASEAPLRMATLIPIGVPHVTVEIRDAANRQLVTAIEILSPTHKQSTGREAYLARRQQILLSTAHLLEIDLLRAGRRVPMMEQLPPVPYFVLVSRAENRPITDVWPIQLADPLPIIPVPLLPGDEDVPLDLQAAFTSVYDMLRYQVAINYTQPPEVPLDETSSAWLVQRLRDAGLRPDKSP